MKTLKLVIENYEFEVPVFEHQGKNWVALKPLCDALGINSQSQARRVQLSRNIRVCHMTHPSSGGRQTMVCVEIDSIGEWIFGINPNKVKPEIKERMFLFRRKLQTVLYAAVTGHIDVNMVQTMAEEIKALKTIIQTLNATVDYLLKKDVLNNQYVDKQLASVGGKLLSNLSHKKRKHPEVAL